MRKNVCYDINYDLPFDADMQIFTAHLYFTHPLLPQTKLKKFLNININKSLCSKSSSVLTTKSNFNKTLNEQYLYTCESVHQI